MTASPDPADPALRAHTRAERERLADLLAALSPAEWDAPTLCEGWRVREVVAHLTLPFRTGTPRFLAGLARARFSFNRYADTAARRDAARMTEADLLHALRANIDHPWQPPGGGPVGALSHDLIHGLDITEPLGLPPAPTDRIALVLAHTSPRSLAFFGVDLTGVQLRATDADIRVGTGEPVDLPAKELLLTLAGRRPLPAPERTGEPTGRG
ncbi:maleylpyruvate isomerase family mycothiol-dependent enzyme [Streptacidiphilus rugosus]|uniref:maleylpyruvate isomerase family mycothiol-dependent enzyme n=1 Tax=Streptacidiphilus rugosus TaxID=405783 RepID=UPI000561776C|nr:maleylpyruvate isomerase family mycothiol-dependent enzyme [Streptacidiphilus rugosus]